MDRGDEAGGRAGHASSATGSRRSRARQVGGDEQQAGPDRPTITTSRSSSLRGDRNNLKTVKRSHLTQQSRACARTAARIESASQNAHAGSIGAIDVGIMPHLKIILEERRARSVSSFSAFRTCTSLMVPPSSAPLRSLTTCVAAPSRMICATVSSAADRKIGAFDDFIRFALKSRMRRDTRGTGNVSPHR